jgi:hypothetical protein
VSVAVAVAFDPAETAAGAGIWIIACVTVIVAIAEPAA